MSKKHNKLEHGEFNVTEYSDAYHFRFKNKSAAIKLVDGDYCLFFKNIDKDKPIDKPAIHHEVLRGKVRQSFIKLSPEAMFAIAKGFVWLHEKAIKEYVYDEEDLKGFCEDAILAYLEKLKEYQDGNRALIWLFMGEVMKQTRGKADPVKANEILKKLLESKNEK